MLNLMGVELDFDITAPEDLDRYISACEKLDAASKTLPGIPGTDDPMEWSRGYRDWVQANCDIVTNFIDDVFGEGAANQLLGPKTSLKKILDVYDAIQQMANKQAEIIVQNTLRFAPNRATRRATGSKTR